MMKTSMRTVIIGVLTVAVLGAVLAASSRNIAILPDEPKRVVVDARDPRTEPQDHLPSVKIEQPVSGEPFKTAPSGAPNHSSTIQVQTEIHRTPVVAPDLPEKSDENKHASDAKSAHAARQPVQSTFTDKSQSAPDSNSESTAKASERNIAELPFVPAE